ncbi:hypothetical protein F2P81_014986 [Scophthalmus maximus]|uniref:Uncharacterized protein n=1 Tax=Scophthalmus maximus TaxID=52904 RepID=A0A6A4SBZ9_SCOMX|nr:hypothetical protein F2P81_014986 [Scophthalmus maximus]
MTHCTDVITRRGVLSRPSRSACVARTVKQVVGLRSSPRLVSHGCLHVPLSRSGAVRARFLSEDRLTADDVRARALRRDCLALLVRSCINR